MLMVLKEDIQNLVFKCEKILVANENKLKRLKKEYKMLSKVIRGYDISEDNSIVYNEVCTRHTNVVRELEKTKNESKWVKKVLSKIIPLLNSLEIIEDTEPEDTEPEDTEPEDTEPEDIEIGQLDY